MKPLFLILWYISGVTLWLFDTKRSFNVITIGDLLFALTLGGLAGPTIILHMLMRGDIPEFFNKRIF